MGRAPAVHSADLTVACWVASRVGDWAEMSDMKSGSTQAERTAAQKAG